MRVREAIQQRRAVRVYKIDPVPVEALQQMLESARRAPSAMNLQPWKFIVVTDAALREALKEAASGQSQVAQAPVVLVCLADPAACDRMVAKMEAYATNPALPAPMRESFLERRIPLRDNAQVRRTVAALNSNIAIAYLTLAAKDLGLDTCWMTGFEESKVKAILGVPESMQVAALLTVGYAAEPVPAAETERLPLADMAFSERFGQPFPGGARE
ncbi:oxidoreductase [Heliobacterium undosum]|uniref:Oxidoreductase n=1 Tax=Heliomicrobium undosum TaxID=121734 RepID=A0A845KYG1_9FIRM|nr:nitroreductase family protein [Heliomicrobium undosum]MZP28912.1 oxidoreductase [Heliomicrobium undosum]